MRELLNGKQWQREVCTYTFEHKVVEMTSFMGIPRRAILGHSHRWDLVPRGLSILEYCVWRCEAYNLVEPKALGKPPSALHAWS